MTQKERIVDYLTTQGDISPYEAFLYLGITKLATRVSELIRDGYPIAKRMVTERNRWGENVCYMRYSWRDDDGERL